MNVGKQIALTVLLAATAAPEAAASPRDQARWLNSRAIALPVDGVALPRLPAGLVNARIVLLGEVHGLAHGQLADLALLRMLHRQTGVRNYLGEFDAAQADTFNRFVETGNPHLLDQVFAVWRKRGLQWANRDFRAKLVAIADWNRSLPASRRIRFFGADQIQDRPAFCAWLAGRLARSPGGSAKARLAAALGDPEGCAGAESLAEEAIRESRQLDAVTADAMEALAVEARFRTRDDRIEANARRHLARQPGRFHGLWGIFHVVQAQVNASAPLALRLARSGIRVRSLAILNLGGEMMIPVQDQHDGLRYENMPYTVDNVQAALVNGIEPFAAAARGPLTLFPLGGRNSPFKNSDALTRVGGRMGEMQPFQIDPATAPHGLWTDGVIISRNSPPTEAVSTAGG
jgi:hypothetical protein